ncbi:MAG: sarcosine oxidase subunit alpha family protein [Burkholderiaceae bacterium]
MNRAVAPGAVAPGAAAPGAAAPAVPGQAFRLPSGGVVDRSASLTFSFDGRDYVGHPGDTLASALLANGVRLVGRSFKYHRPRGIMSAGSEEPNALVDVGPAGRSFPNTPATMLPLYSGLRASSQHAWPSLRFDLRRLNEVAAPLIPAGFYYKTFMWPPRGWRVYEHFIRRAAGLGGASTVPDSERYEYRHAHCDVLVVGAGASGLSAALAAARRGARVIVVDEHDEAGGRLRFDTFEIDSGPASDWVRSTLAELRSLPDVSLLLSTTASARFDHGMVALVERCRPVGSAGDRASAQQRLWIVRARRIVLAAGAIERPLVFANNDRPGVMMASALRAYVNRFAVAPGRRALIWTTNDDAYRSALDLADAGIEVAAVLDVRENPAGSTVEAVRRKGVPVLTGHAVLDTRGGRALRAAIVGSIRGGAAPRRIACDVLGMSGGWSPAIHLSSHLGSKPRYDEALQAFAGKAGPDGLAIIGAAAGRGALRQCLDDGWQVGAAAAEAAGLRQPVCVPAPACAAVEQETVAAPAGPFGRGGKQFVDFQGDVTVADIELSVREGMSAPEHLKRYTTLGMWTDQGKTSAVNGLAVLARATDRQLAGLGATSFRPPYTPMPIGVIAGRALGRRFQPIRQSAMHARHEEAGAIFVEAGLWLRPRAYPKPGELLGEAAAREVDAVRSGVGIVDISTLGKIDVQGPDSLELLERVYVNGWRNLAVGRARYGLMLREDGIAFDDGTVARLGEYHYLITTTTANASKVLSQLEFLLQTQWTQLRVDVSSATEHWAAIAVAGPKSRDLLSDLPSDIDFAGPAFPHTGVRCGRLADMPVRVFRLSYSGELAYEIHVPAAFGDRMWRLLLDAGRQLGVLPYGTEAMGIMRIEKGHIAGPELDGRTTASDLGLGRLLRPDERFVGARMCRRLALQNARRPALVGLVPIDGHSALRAGSLITSSNGGDAGLASIGHVSSAAFSPTLGHPIALAFVQAGPARLGETLMARFPLADEAVPVRVTPPVFVDPEGERVKA